MLIASAATFEIAPLRVDFSQDPFVSFFTFGIGAIEAARREGAFLSAAEGKDVWLVGTCGSWSAFSGVSLITTDRLIWLPMCERAKLAESIEGVESSYSLMPGKAVSGLPVYTLLCGPTISISDFIHPQIQKKFQIESAQLAENIELYVCAKNLLSVAKSVHVLLAITNQVGADGRKQWKENFQAAAKITSAFIRDHILSTRT